MIKGILNKLKIWETQYIYMIYLINRKKIMLIKSDILKKQIEILFKNIKQILNFHNSNILEVFI